MARPSDRARATAQWPDHPSPISHHPITHHPITRSNTDLFYLTDAADGGKVQLVLIN
jgi:hypothetical protein